jgi:hypothetical protein
MLSILHILWLPYALTGRLIKGLKLLLQAFSFYRKEMSRQPSGYCTGLTVMSDTIQERAGYAGYFLFSCGVGAAG